MSGSDSRDIENRPPVIGYMCGTAWEHDLGSDELGVPVYSSEEDLRADRRCADECGVVEVEVRLHRIVSKSKF